MAESDSDEARSPAVVGIDHVQLAMPHGRESEAGAFYSDVLGLQQVEKPAPLRERGGVWFEGNGVAVHLGVEQAFQAAKKAHPAFLVTGYAKLRARCVAAGIDVADDPLPFNGKAHCYVSDPFGNRIELIDAGQ